MKGFKLILIFLVFGLFSKAHGVPAEVGTDKIAVNISHSGKIEKKTDAVKATDSKVNKQKHPKKPKGIKVAIPNVSSHVFHQFHSYSELTINEVEGIYTFSLHYSNGKRGPPSLIA